MVVSKLRPEDYSFGVGHSGMDREGRCVTLRFHDFTLVGGYSPCTRPGEAVSDRRVSYEAAMRLHLLREVRTGREVLYAGDLNVAPAHADVDVGGLTCVELASAPGCTEKERALLATTMRDAGMANVYRKHHPVGGECDFTWRTRQPRRPPEARGHKIPSAMRIDIFLATPGVLDCSRSCEVLRQGTSDHYPVLLSMEAPALAGLSDEDLGRACAPMADYGAGRHAAKLFASLSKCAAVHERDIPPLIDSSDSESECQSSDEEPEQDGSECDAEGAAGRRGGGA